MPVWFGDYVYCAGSILMAFTSGYFSSLVMMYAPRYVLLASYKITVFFRIWNMRGVNQPLGGPLPPLTFPSLRSRPVPL